MIPSMVSIGERVALRDYLAMNYQGIGEVVEIGAFCGSSAIAIMQGVQRTKFLKKLHVYDAFKFPKNDLEKTYRKMLPGMHGESFREAFDFTTRAWKDAMVVYEGDASKAKWGGAAIEFMHIDCSISREFHETIAREFYPNLLVGGAIAHQDYDYGRAPFIADIMHRLEKWFRPYMHVETTQYFVCMAPVTRAEVTAALCEPEKAAA